MAVNHARRLTTCSAHLPALLVGAGQPVRRGAVIGLVGCTGRCFGGHVRFEVRLDADEQRQPVDPMPYLRGG